MSVWGVTMVRDEADIIESTIARMLWQVDAILVADNGSTDGTREILERLDVTLVHDPQVGYYQSTKMTNLALKARDLGAEWVVPFDADEVWLGERGSVTDWLNRLPPEAMCSEAMLYQHMATAKDEPGADPIASMVYRQASPAVLRKVACRPRDGFGIDQGNHWVNYGGPRVMYPLSITRGLEVRHYPYRSAEQFIRKARNGAEAYAATDLPEHVGAHWRGYGRILDEGGPDALTAVFREHHYSEDPETDGLVLDPCP